MISKCPSCKKELFTEHAFCPNCGFDLRIKKEINKAQEIPIDLDYENANTTPKNSYVISLLAGAIFSVVSIFIWSYVFVGFRFDVNSFFSRLANHTFWIFLFPFIISLLFKKVKRPIVFSRVVTATILLGIIFLFFGYSQFSYNTDPSLIRVRLLMPCTDDVIQQMDKVDLPDSIKKIGATAYCECLTNKMTDIYIVKIGLGQNNFWDIVNQTYKEESLKCIEGSTQLPPPPDKKKRKSYQLWMRLYDSKYYTKSYDQFMASYGNPAGQANLYKQLKAAEYYTKSFDDFRNKYFIDETP